MAMAGPGLGSIRDIVEERTVLPLYLRFASAELAEMVVSAASQNSSGRLKFQLGLLTSRFRANHPLKGCPACMTEDRHDHATAYWHREHQLPGVWVCQKHGCWLSASDLKATGVSRFHWLLPSPEHLGATAETSPPPTVQMLARMVAGVASRSEMRFSAQALRLTYRTALIERNLLIGTEQRLQHREAGERYAAFVAPLRLVTQLSGLPDSPKAAAAEVFRLIQPVRSGIHPLRHLTLAAYLFRDPEEFFEAYGRVSALEASLEGEHAPAKLTSAARRVHPDKARFLDLVIDGHSVSAAAREVGVDTTTGLAWAAVHGIAVSRRPKLLKDEIRRAVITLLRQGVDKVQVAQHAKVSIQTITTLLRTEIGLHSAWKQAQFSNAQRRHRHRWEGIVDANPLSGVKAARLAEPATYAWLYRNDRDWLIEKTGAMASAIRMTKPQVDWDARDRDLADLVRREAMRRVSEMPERKLRMCHLRQCIPELDARVSRLDQLPLTRSAIFEVLGRSPAAYLGGAQGAAFDDDP